MAIIYTYGFDNNVQDNDAWIGTNATNRKTKQFTVASVANYLNNAGRIAVGGQMTFKFVTSGASNGTISIPSGGGAGTNFTDIASLYVSIVDTSGANVTEWLNYLVGQELLLSEQNEPNNFGHYRITSYTVDTNPNFYTLVLTDIGGYGVITADTYYNLNNVNLISGNVDPTGLEAINEGNGIGWRLIGRDADNYGPIGLNAIDFSNSDSISTERGSTGENSITFGNNNINQQSGSIVLGANQSVKITDTFQGANIITGFDNFIWGATYSSLIAAYRSTIGVEGTNYTTNALYQSLIVGDGHNYYAGRDSGVVGGGLISGSTGCFTVGIANEDLTTTTSNWLTAQYNNYGPRFVVGVGTYTPTTGIAGVRQNGFVVMSDGTATFPVLSNAMIDAAGDDSAVTKGWVNSGPALTSEQVRIEVKNTSGVTLVKGTPVYITGTVGATIRAEIAAADASSSATMPAVGVLAQDLINNADGYAVTGGFLSNVTTDPIDGITPVANQTVYVKPGGGLTLTKPTGSNLIQNIAKVGKISGGSAGSLVISSILRTNDVPNLTTGKIWVGTAANTSESTVVHLDESNGRMGIGTASPAQALDVAGSIATSGVIVGPTPFEIYSEFTNRGRITLSSGTSTGANQIAFLTDGTAKMVINKEGNVGIGTTSPSEKLEVDGTFTVTGNSTIQGRTNIQKDLIIRGTDALANQGATRFYVDNSNRLFIDTANDGANLFTIDSSGNVGIGTTSPSEKLNVAGNQRLDGDEIYITQAGSARKPVRLHQSAYKGAITLQRDGVDNVNISSDFAEQGHTYFNGTNVNVGIGTTSPSQKLHVDGITYSTSGYKLDNGFSIGALGYNSAVRFNNGNILVNNSSSAEFVRFDATNSRVGIGTTSPTDLLHLEGASTPTLKIVDTTNTTITELYSNDFDTYLANESSGRVFIRTGGSNGFVVDSAGDVGIGTTNPIYKLDIQAESPAIRIQDISDANSFLVGADNSGGYLGMFTNDSLRVYTNSLERLRIDSTGNVGIGTASPSYKLDVTGDIRATSEIFWGDNSGPVGRMYSGSQTAVVLNTADTGIVQLSGGSTSSGGGNISLYGGTHATFPSIINFRNGGADAMRIIANGNVGIGTTNPATKLEVAGVTTVRKSGIATPHADTDLLVTDATAAGSTAQIQILGGNAGNSHLYFSDTDNYSQGGIQYLHASDSMNIRVNATTAITIDSSRNVGIGTTSPSAKLHIDAGTAEFKVQDAFNGGFNGAQITGTNAALGFIGGNLDEYILTALNDGSFRVYNPGGAGYAITLTNTGRLGIGTTSPQEKLDISAGSIRLDDNQRITWASTDANVGRVRITGSEATDIITFVTDNSEKMRLTNTGLGIGTTTPAAKLDVDGGIRMADDTATASATNVGTLRYRTSGNNSYVDMCMQTGAATYAWVNIVQNNW